MKNFKELGENLRNKVVKDKPPIMSYDEFHKRITAFRFPEATDSYYHYVKAQREEKILFEEAMRGGMQHLNLFREYQQHWAIQKLNEQHLELNTRHQASLAKAYQSGDEAYDQFTALCRRHDFYYSYSDDIQVWRNGEASYAKIQDLITEQPPGRKELYQAYWNLIVQTNTKTETP